MDSSQSCESPDPESLDIDEFYAYHRRRLPLCTASSRHEVGYNPELVQDLTEALNLLIERNELRRRAYGADADQSRLGHTPPETRAKIHRKADKAVRVSMRAQKSTRRKSKLGFENGIPAQNRDMEEASHKESPTRCNKFTTSKANGALKKDRSSKKLLKDKVMDQDVTITEEESERDKENVYTGVSFGDKAKKDKSSHGASKRQSKKDKSSRERRKEERHDSGKIVKSKKDKGGKERSEHKHKSRKKPLEERR